MNAGAGSLTAFEEVHDFEAYRGIMDVNYWGCVYLTHYALPIMKKQTRKAVLCVVSSTLGKIGASYRYVFCFCVMSFINLLLLVPVMLPPSTHFMDFMIPFTVNCLTITVVTEKIQSKLRSTARVM